MLTDGDYNHRIAFSLVDKSLSAFIKQNGETWRTTETENSMNCQDLDGFLASYQQPEKVDNISAIQSDLNEVHSTMVKSIEQLLDRGEKLGDVISKSEDLSDSSKMFLQQSKGDNCCGAW